MPLRVLGQLESVLGPENEPSVPDNSIFTDCMFFFFFLYVRISLELKTKTPVKSKVGLFMVRKIQDGLLVKNG